MSYAKLFPIVGHLSLGVGLTTTCGARLGMEQNRNNLLQYKSITNHGLLALQ